MARHTEGPMTDDELAEAKAQIQELREEVREDLADDLGGDPEDYNAETYWKNGRGESGSEAVPDGGDSK